MRIDIYRDRDDNTYTIDKREWTGPRGGTRVTWEIERWNGETWTWRVHDIGGAYSLKREARAALIEYLKAP